MLVGLQPIYLLNVLGISSKSSCATLCHFKKSKFSFTKTSRWKFLDLKPTHFAVRIAAPLGNNRSTAEERGERMLNVRNTSTQICRYIELYGSLFFFEIAETISVMLLICGFAVDFNFFTANVCGKKSVRKSANQNLKSAICGFADRFAEVPSTENHQINFAVTSLGCMSPKPRDVAPPKLQTQIHV